MPTMRITISAMTIASGRLKAITSEARQLPRNKSNNTMTSTVASPSARMTVPTARSTRWPRS